MRKALGIIASFLVALSMVFVFYLLFFQSCSLYVNRVQKENCICLGKKISVETYLGLNTTPGDHSEYREQCIGVVRQRFSY